MLRAPALEPAPRRIASPSHIGVSPTLAPPTLAPTAPSSSRKPRSEPLRVPSRARTVEPVAPCIPGLMAYAMRSNDGQGVVFDDFEAARSLYHRLQLQGHSVTLASSPSITDSVVGRGVFFRFRFEGKCAPRSLDSRRVCCSGMSNAWFFGVFGERGSVVRKLGGGREFIFRTLGTSN